MSCWYVIISELLDLETYLTTEEIWPGVTFQEHGRPNRDIYISSNMFVITVLHANV